MKIKSKWIIALLSLILVFSLAACGSDDADEATADCWADQYAALLDSGEARDYADYDSMKAALDVFREECGATYVYVLTPGTDGEPDINGEYGEGASFLITVDGSEDPDDWGVDYGWQIQFTEAWEGTPAAARSAWDDRDELQCWSAFAPVYDSEGNVVCILGIDYPCTEVAQANPEWNRDAEEWNGFEDEITGEVPADVQEMIDKVTALADKYAKQLSYQE